MRLSEMVALDAIRAGYIIVHGVRATRKGLGWMPPWFHVWRSRRRSSISPLYREAMIKLLEGADNYEKEEA